MVLARPDVLIEILEEHLDELSFLLELRHAQRFDEEETPADLAALDERIETHLDGLRVGLGRTADLAFPLLEDTDPSLAMAAAFVLFSLDEPGIRETVVDLLPDLPPGNQDAVRLALRRAPISGAAGKLRNLAKDGPPLARAVALDVLAYRRLTPSGRGGPLFSDPDPLVRRIALSAASRALLGLSGPVLEAALADEDPSVRSTALEAAARLGLSELPRICRHAAKTASVPEAIAFLGVFGGREDLAFLDRCSGNPELAGPALTALGAMGRPEIVPHLIRAMRREELRRPAGAAFVRITGAGIEAEERPAPPPDATEDEIDVFDDSAPPDPEKAEAFWSAHESSFAPDRIWQCGLDVSSDPFGPGFDALSLAARRDVYLRERLKNPGAAPELELEVP